jgi:hypothetical protein
MIRRPAVFALFGTIIPLLLTCAVVPASRAQQPAVDLGGTWVLNAELSDDTDEVIEKSIRKAGGRPDSGGKRGKGRYKGGPPEQEIYDHLAYDETLAIVQSGAQISITYDGQFNRTFFTDGRGRTVSASGMSSGDRKDFSFGAWSGSVLNVEAKPRDGGWTREVYTVSADGRQLHVHHTLKPLLFPVVIELNRYFDRQP